MISQLRSDAEVGLSSFISAFQKHLSFTKQNWLQFGSNKQSVTFLVLFLELLAPTVQYANFVYWSPRLNLFYPSKDKDINLLGLTVATVSQYHRCVQKSDKFITMMNTNVHRIVKFRFFINQANAKLSNLNSQIFHVTFVSYQHNSKVILITLHRLNDHVNFML